MRNQVIFLVALITSAWTGQVLAESGDTSVVEVAVYREDGGAKSMLHVKLANNTRPPCHHHAHPNVMLLHSDHPDYEQMLRIATAAMLNNKSVGVYGTGGCVTYYTDSWHGHVQLEQIRAIFVRN